MANGIDGEINGCIFQWKILNISHCWWLKTGQQIESPAFIADAVEGTKWSLCMCLVDAGFENFVGVYLYREEDCCGPDEIEVICEIAFLSKDGSLIIKEIHSCSFRKDHLQGLADFCEKERIFITQRKELLHEDSLTVQCTIWNGEDKPVKSKHLYAQTVFKANRRSLVWRIDKFSTPRFASRNKFKDGLIHIDLVLNERLGFEKNIIIIMNYFDECMKYFSMKAFIIDSEGKKENCGMSEYFADDLNTGVLSFKLDFPKKLIEDRNLYFPNDVLCLNCDFVFSTETVRQNEFGSGGTFTYLKCESVENKNEYYVVKGKSQNTTVLTDDLKSMYKDGILSDTELRTSTKTFHAHRNILSARSSVFRRMFNSDTKEKNEGQVDITDFDEDTVHRMLLYIYAESLEDLQLESACKLYTAAIKYDIFSLKSKCSSFLKHNLCPTKACDVLILADKYQDNDLKSAVQDYILNHEDVFISKEWKNFMVTNIELAADIMYRKINTGKILSCSE